MWGMKGGAGFRPPRKSRDTPTQCRGGGNFPLSFGNKNISYTHPFTWESVAIFNSLPVLLRKLTMFTKHYISFVFKAIQWKAEVTVCKIKELARPLTINVFRMSLLSKPEPKSWVC